MTPKLKLKNSFVEDKKNAKFFFPKHRYVIFPSIPRLLVSVIRSQTPGARSYTLTDPSRDRQVVDRRLDRQLVVSDRC